MDPRPALALAAVALVAVAGCGAAPFGSDTRPTPAETLTPVPVSTPPESTATPVERPPGVTTGGVVDTRRLGEAHDAAVANRSYRWTLEYDVDRSGQATVFDGGFTRQAVVEPDRFLVRQREDDRALNGSLFVNETGGYLRTVEDNVTRTETLVRPGTSDDYVVSGQLVERFLSGMNPTVTRVDRDGRTYYRLHDRTGVPPTLERLAMQISDYSVTAYVSPEGFVRSMTVSYVRSTNSESERVTVRFYYEDVGSATVDRPAWVDGLSLPTRTPARPSQPDTPTARSASGNVTRTETATPAGPPTATPTLTTAENATGS
jgi:hypothetical protein